MERFLRIVEPFTEPAAQMQAYRRQRLEAVADERQAQQAAALTGLLESRAKEVKDLYEEAVPLIDETISRVDMDDPAAVSAAMAELRLTQACAEAFRISVACDRLQED